MAFRGHQRQPVPRGPRMMGPSPRMRGPVPRMVPMVGGAGVLHGSQMSSNMQNPPVVSGPPPNVMSMPQGGPQAPHMGPLVPNMCNTPRFQNRGSNQQFPFPQIGGAVGLMGQAGCPPQGGQMQGMHNMGGGQFPSVNMTNQQVMPPRQMHPYVGDKMENVPPMPRHINENFGAGPPMHGHSNDNMRAGPIRHGPVTDSMGAGPPVQGHMTDNMGVGPPVQGHMSDGMGVGPPMQGHMPLPDTMNLRPHMQGHTMPESIGVGPHMQGPGNDSIGTGPHVQGPMSDRIGVGPPMQGGPNVQGVMHMSHYQTRPGPQHHLGHRHDDQRMMGQQWLDQHPMVRNCPDDIPGYSVHDRRNVRDVDHRAGMSRDVDRRRDTGRDVDHRRDLPGQRGRQPHHYPSKMGGSERGMDYPPGPPRRPADDRRRPGGWQEAPMGDMSPKRPRDRDRNPDRDRERSSSRQRAEPRDRDRRQNDRGYTRNRDSHGSSDRGGSYRSSRGDKRGRSPSQTPSHRSDKSDRQGSDRSRSRSSRRSPDRGRSWDHRSQHSEVRGSRTEKTPRPQPKPAPREVSESPPSSPLGDFLSLDNKMEALNDLSDYLNKVDEEASKKKEEAEEQAEVSSPVPAWIRCSPADLYFRRHPEKPGMSATKKMEDLQDKFDSEVAQRAAQVRQTKPAYEKPPRPNPVLSKHHHHQHHDHSDGSDCSDGHGGSSSDDDDDDDDDDDSDLDNDVAHGWVAELTRKQQHPERLHEELWFNEPGEMNDGPLCRCSLKSKKSGIRHDIYPGETLLPKCEPNTNNQPNLYHYRITMSPHTNFLTKNPTIIEYDNHEYIFEGFSLLSHYKLENVPVCKVIRFNIEYTIHWFEEDLPENFSLRSLDHFTDYLFYEILELLDLDWKPKDGGCSRFHLMPRFARDLPDNGKEILSMNEVLHYLLRSARPLLEETELVELLAYEKHEWQDWVDKVRGMIVTCPGMRPSSIRIDQLDREQHQKDVITYPMIIHFGIRPAQLSYAGDPNYQKLWKQYVKFKHLLANKPKITIDDKNKLERKEDQLQEMRMKSSMKREVTVELSAQGFIKTGIKSDVCQHAMLLPVLIGHLRFHKCLDVLEGSIQYKFKDRMLLQLALTHPSYRVNFGTNPDHARNSLSNCGIRQPEYGDRRIHHVHTRKRGINTLISIMSRLGRKEETASEINHYERLEFLGDAVVEFMSSIHLYYMFPSLEEGGLATYRAAIVQNQHLAVLAKKLHLHDFMLYAHGPDLCHESDLRHAMANCLEALMGALFLDGGIELADRIFGEVLFDDDPELLKTWMNLPVHPLQEDEPNGDRHWVSSSPALQKLLKFEDVTGTQFNHIRLLARAFTMRNVGYNNLTFGHNQRLEFLGDTVLQLVASEYLFKHFPEHHEGHLSLLRSSLVNNRTQAVVCDDLGMTDYIIHADHRPYDQAGMKHKEKADLLEAFIGGLYVDKDLEFCRVFCHVCFFPRLKQFILNQDWNDPKSQLQQCCLTLRELDGGEPDIPIYKVIASTGPTNTRKYTVAVYFRGERLATGTGHSIQQAEMNAATNALKDRGELFPQLAHQKKFIEKKYKRRRRKSKQHDNEPKSALIRNEIKK